MADLNIKFWTYQLVNGIFTIDETLALTEVSFVLTDGAATFIGEVQAGANPSTAIDLAVGVPITLSSGNPYLITGITIDASSGTVAIVGRK